MNRLIDEQSPYLRQHAHNPVDWYAWKPEAFERAKAEQKPILVSIGYSTCHWCHVMERESFEDKTVAEFMNSRFVNIKVDREERPDVDAVYMEACQILSGSGGWPLNCFLTPEGKPFFAGTYYPPRPAYNRPSWMQLLEYLAGVWEEERSKAYDQAEQLLAHIRRNDGVFLTPIGPKLPDRPFPEDLLPKIFAAMRERFDVAEGGFGGAPKFPSTMALRFLLHYHHYTGDPQALEHALFSLDKMIRGGIFDHLGGGFARYSTDREWLVPHFEKMLYDNALLTSVMSDALKIANASPGLERSGRRLREAIESTLEYIAREMTHPEGGFYAAQDADSEGVEGKFFVWTKAEIEEALGEDAGIFCDFYDVSSEGNWEERNILHRLHDEDIFAEMHLLDPEIFKAKMSACRDILFRLRSQRIPPGLDDKILLGWNALMVSAYVNAFTALGREEYREAALRNMDFLTRHFAPRKGELFWKHTWKDGVAQYDAFLDDYALLIAAAIDVWQISFEKKYLDLAQSLCETVFTHFYDESDGLFFFTHDLQADIILRKKDLYDNATPSGNSTMVLNLQRLHALLDLPPYKRAAQKMLLSMAATLERYPLSFERWVVALGREIYPLHEIAIVGEGAGEKALLMQKYFIPNKVIAAGVSSEENIALLSNKLPGDPALIYICRDFTCQRPVESLEEASAIVRQN